MINLVMPMAGRGSRFSRAGIVLPKPLIELKEYPFFWWAIQSIYRVTPVKELICVVLQEHIESFDIDKRITHYFPEARFVILPEVTAGAFETAFAGVSVLSSRLPTLVNDCDHAFDARGIEKHLAVLHSAEIDGLLCHFRSHSPGFSYAQYDEEGCLIRTAEKDPISDLAIAGAYGFRDPEVLRITADRYRTNCTYSELYLSGIFNVMVQEGKAVRGFVLPSHLSFGTPEELRQVDETSQLLKLLAT